MSAEQSRISIVYKHGCIDHHGCQPGLFFRTRLKAYELWKKHVHIDKRRDRWRSDHCLFVRLCSAETGTRHMRLQKIHASHSHTSTVYPSSGTPADLVGPPGSPMSGVRVGPYRHKGYDSRKKYSYMYEQYIQVSHAMDGREHDPSWGLITHSRPQSAATDTPEGEQWGS